MSPPTDGSSADDESHQPHDERRAGRGLQRVIWSAGIAVALGAAVATAHGLYEVAVAANVPGGIAWLYPLITDGLALVAYAATARLSGREARYAWTVVIVAAGLSGLAQAAYLAGDGAGPTQVAPALRFGIGAWPAVAAAVVAHLLYLLATSPDPTDLDAAGGVQPEADVQRGRAVHPDRPGVQPDPGPAGVQPHPGLPSTAPPRALPSPARDRAEAAAERHARRHGHWPTVSELQAVAEVSRGTAAAALKTLRERPLPLHALPAEPTAPTPDASRTDPPYADADGVSLPSHETRP